MKDVLRMAGRYAARAIWSISDGETLIPIVGYLNRDNNTSMERLAMGSAQALDIGEKRVSTLGPDKRGAVFIKDGMVTLETGKTDALILDVAFADEPAKRLQLLIPYRHASHSDGFAVHRLKVARFAGVPVETMDSLVDAFIEGMESHSEGGRIWRERYVDQAGVSTGHYGDENTEFSAEEFDALKKAPFLIFFIVAAADGKVDEKELKSFIKLLSAPEMLNNKLLNRIVTNVIAQVPSLLRAMALEEINYIAELITLRIIVENKLPPDEANAFKNALLALGKEIAMASGGILCLGRKVSADEKSALAGIALCLGISPA